MQSELRMYKLLGIFLLTLGTLMLSTCGELPQRVKVNYGTDCPTDIKNCIEPITSKICSGNGACVCGQCACFQTDFELFYGRFCQHCESCSPNHCETLRPCVECRIHASGDYKSRQECEANCSKFPQIQIDQVSSSGEKDGHYFCSFRDSENCEFYFMYGYDATGHLVIIAERDKECPLVDTAPPTHGREISEKLRDHHRFRKLSRPVTPPPLFTSPSAPPTRGSEPQSAEPLNFPHILMMGNRTHPHLRSSFDTVAAGGSDTPDSGRSSKPRVLNTQAFDLMIVCGLRLTRTSKRTTQTPDYFHRNGIHFDVENCQFLPRSQSFVLPPDYDTDTRSESSDKDPLHGSDTVSNEHSSATSSNLLGSYLRVIIFLCFLLPPLGLSSSFFF